jgi:hypothetical protein
MIDALLIAAPFVVCLAAIALGYDPTDYEFLKREKERMSK